MQKKANKKKVYIYIYIYIYTYFYKIVNFRKQRVVIYQ